MGNQENTYTWGDWTDSNGNVYQMPYNIKWKNHIFTEAEQKRLLAGDEITFIINEGQSVTGHFQYSMNKGNERFGFVSKYFVNDYVPQPIYHGVPQTSTYLLDLQREKAMAEYMGLYYYKKLLNKDETRVDYKRIEDEKEQKRGIDVIYTQNGIKYVVDEKAQLDYIYNKKPLPTFALELVNSSSGAIGWFVNTKLETNYYMFIWPNAKRDSLTIEERKKKPLKIEDIRYADFALVNKETLQIEVEEKLNKSPEQLLEYAKIFSQYCKELENSDGNVPLKEGIESDPGKEEGQIKGYRYFGDGFSKRKGYLYYSKNKSERPVSLVVRREWLEEKAEICGKITSSKVEIIR